MTVTWSEYEKDFGEFLKKHQKGSNEISVSTSPMTNDRYHKTYASTDGGEFTEINERVTEMAEAEIHGLKVTVPVVLYRTEYWSTDNSKSKFVYSK